MTYVTYKFELPQDFKDELKTWPVNMGYNGLGEITYLRTYSRKKPDGSQETWHDTVIRCVEGVFSIRKDYYIKNNIYWRDEDYYAYAIQMAMSMFDIQFLPPGRGLWALGTDYVYERGAAALQNCGFVSVETLSEDVPWAMDMLMCGVGVGFDTYSLKNAAFFEPVKTDDLYEATIFQIPDTREGWVESVGLLLNSYEHPNQPQVLFDYTKIRKAGEPIHGFGGTASGPEPLEKLHNRIRAFMDKAVENQTSPVRLITDIMNAVGACVVAGNVRRSAELALGEPTSEEFLNLKNFHINPDRQEIAWMSNNSVVFNGNDYTDEQLDDIATRIRDNGEPGIINLKNVQTFGRMGERMSDMAVGFNPCGEQPLESYELCNLVEVFPTRCKTTQELDDAVEYATFFASTISLLPTHDARTNEIIAKNRRIGVSMSGLAEYLDQYGEVETSRMLDKYYTHVVCPVNTKLAREAGVNESVRVTTVKPSGTISLLAGVSPGMHWPTFEYAIRRIRIADNSPLLPALREAGYVTEPDKNSDNTTVVEFPIEQSSARPAKEVSLETQAKALRMYQKYWSDNAVSCTLYFDPRTEDHLVSKVLKETIPHIKSLSMLPHTEAGAYEQMPYEGITKEQYEKLVENLKPINLIEYITQGTSDGQDSRFCSNDTCEIDFSAMKKTEA